MEFLAFCAAARTYCGLTGGSVTSWGRSVFHNGEVGGVTYSAHCAWMAVDVVYDKRPDPEWCSQWAARLGLRLIHEGDHDHLQPVGWTKG